MKASHLYLALTILGAALPLSQFVPLSLEGNFTLSRMISATWATPMVRGFTLDLLIAALSGVVFMIVEGRRLRIRHLWMPLAGTVLVGFSFGLPLFLYLREHATQHQRG